MKVKLLTKTAKSPIREHNSQGYDLFTDENTNLFPEEVKLVSTGIAIEIPLGYVGKIYPKSGLGHKEGIVLGNLVGIIDSDYRGEVKVSLWNRNPVGTTGIRRFKKGEKIAQLLIEPVITPELQIVKELSETSRGKDGFGSTGTGLKVSVKNGISRIDSIGLNGNDGLHYNHLDDGTAYDEGSDYI